MYGAYFLAQRARRPVFRYGAWTIAGALTGILAAYFLAHILTITARWLRFVTFDAGYTFWAVFIAMALIGLMAGGLMGIFFGRKETESPAGR